MNAVLRMIKEKETQRRALKMISTKYNIGTDLYGNLQYSVHKTDRNNCIISSRNCNNARSSLQHLSRLTCNAVV